MADEEPLLPCRPIESKAKRGMVVRQVRTGQPHAADDVPYLRFNLVLYLPCNVMLNHNEPLGRPWLEMRCE
jgi:hypothetical protein